MNKDEMELGWTKTDIVKILFRKFEEIQKKLDEIKQDIKKIKDKDEKID